MRRKIKQIDRQRSQTRAVISGSVWGDPKGYDLTVNTTDWSIKELAPAVADFALRRFERGK